MLREIATALKTRPTVTLVLGAVFTALGVGVGLLVDWKAQAAKPPLLCAGEYADSLLLPLSDKRGLTLDTPAEYTFLVRNTARYECPYYGQDGKLRRRTISAREDGTAFAYETNGQETFLLTNEHVAVWPDVTDSRNRVPGVSEGCRRVESRLRIVLDDRSDDEAGDTALKLVASDLRLDAAILKASKKLPVLPYRIGSEKGLRQGNAVEVSGFPLGLLHAVNTGKVVNPYDLDVEQGWNHVDFVIDALLSEGNSGSPVLALSCRTGRRELVGIFHAGYKEASALNVVVGIDQLREFMAKKKRIPRAAADGPTLSVNERKRLEQRLTAGTLPLFDFGGLTVITEKAEDALRYHLYGRAFPADDRRIAILEDRPAANRFGDLGWLMVRGEAGWRQTSAPHLGDDDRDLLGRVADGLRLHMLRVLEYRRLLQGTSSPEDRRALRDVSKALERQALPERELVASLLDLVERLAPSREGTPVAGNVSLDAGIPGAPTIAPEHIPPSAPL